MNCEEWFDRLYQILDRDLDATTWRKLEAHMKDCRSCWDRLEFEKRVKARIQRACCQETCTAYLIIF